LIVAADPAHRAKMRRAVITRDDNITANHCWSRKMVIGQIRSNRIFEEIDDPGESRLEIFRSY
jgi:hypothetical protein